MSCQDTDCFPAAQLPHLLIRTAMSRPSRWSRVGKPHLGTVWERTAWHWPQGWTWQTSAQVQGWVWPTWSVYRVTLDLEHFQLKKAGILIPLGTFIKWSQYLINFTVTAQYMTYQWSSNLAPHYLGRKSRAGQTFQITPNIAMLLDHFDLRNSILLAIWEHGGDNKEIMKRCLM